MQSSPARLLTAALALCLPATLVSVPAALGGPAAVSPKVAAEVPAAYKKKGTLVVATDATYAPMEFIASNGKTIVGADADLAKALGGVMGLKMRLVNATFDTIIPGLQAHKYDLGISSFTDTKARQKVVDFVTYFSAGESFYVDAKGGPTIETPADLCGRTVAVETGTTEAADAQTQNAKCKQEGKPGVTVSTYPDQNSANLALSSGRAQVGWADSPTAAYIVKQSHGRFKLTGKVYGTAPYGIAIPKGTGLARPILDALEVLMANGTYRSILAKWGLQQGAISNPKINGAIS
jgi:polar amino acid transport system substrate-binding protein